MPFLVDLIHEKVCCTAAGRVAHESRSCSSPANVSLSAGFFVQNKRDRCGSSAVSNTSRTQDSRCSCCSARFKRATVSASSQQVQGHHSERLVIRAASSSVHMPRLDNCSETLPQSSGFLTAGQARVMQSSALLHQLANQCQVRDLPCQRQPIRRRSIPALCLGKYDDV